MKKKTYLLTDMCTFIEKGVEDHTHWNEYPGKREIIKFPLLFILIMNGNDQQKQWPHYLTCR